jgi:hypothetical protein
MFIIIFELLLPVSAFQTWSVSPSVDMLPFGVTMPATVPQRSEIPEGITNYPVCNTYIFTTATMFA